MNKMFFGGLIVSLLTMSLMIFGCDDGTTGTVINEEKVVEEKYRGRWVDDSYPNIYFELTEKGIKGTIASNLSTDHESTAWTVGTALYYRSAAGSIFQYGTFTSDTTFDHGNDITFTRQ